MFLKWGWVLTPLPTAPVSLCELLILILIFYPFSYWVLGPFHTHLYKFIVHQKLTLGLLQIPPPFCHFFMNSFMDYYGLQMFLCFQIYFSSWFLSALVLKFTNIQVACICVCMDKAYQTHNSKSPLSESLWHQTIPFGSLYLPGHVTQ